MTIGRGILLHNLYILQLDRPSTHEQFSGSLIADGILWHQRLGHPSADKLQCISGNFSLSKSKSSFTHPSHCSICHLAKQKRLSYESHNHLSSLPFDLVHLDVWGPFSIESVEGYKYFLTIIDDCTRVTWVYMMKNKSEVTQHFSDFIKHVLTQYKAVIKVIRTDNAPELTFKSIVREHGMIHQFSCAYTPQQNSVVERKHQHLLNVARSLLFQSNVPIAYWSDCLLTAVFLINRIPSVLLKNVSPYELLTKRKPTYDFLRSFGCLCYVSTLQKDRTKFTPRSQKCVFLGYSSGYKGYKVLHIESNCVSVSRNVVFHENIFPFHDNPISSASDVFSNTILPLPAHINDEMHTSSSHHDTTDHSHASSSASQSSTHSSVIPVLPETVPTETAVVSLPIARPKRNGKATAYLSDYHCSFTKITEPLPPHSFPHLKVYSTPYPISSVLSYSNLKSPFLSCVLSYSVETEPKTFK